MKLDSYLKTSNSSGLFELKNDGTILYSRLRHNNQLIDANRDFAGHNFFDEIAGFENARELRGIFNQFVESGQFTDNFVFACLYADRIVPVRVMMVRAFENSYFDSESIVLLDIRNSGY